MMNRLSVVDFIYVNSIAFSSILEIGDSKKITPVSTALAVQREVPLFFTNEGNFSAYSIFSQELPKVTITENMNMNICNQNPIIKVNSIKVTGLSSSSVMQVGSTEIINAEARLKHIRKLLPKRHRTHTSNET
ncbi:spore germination protein GerPE [Ferdinandcohnia quinoae]|uniref:Spore germination protein GerPE n=1 Tax=Fredinandcohnia quinoae TaxID=2918902 RepID=A0AAW5E868_9BACI|nr:spore germination protein GerPE [Fredinandcohnia sp. SECRCQ15]MCH1625825.1 spore germination protein GerPE [Fredinandcohnia sp. SECRCQ15]